MLPKRAPIRYNEECAGVLFSSPLALPYLFNQGTAVMFATRWYFSLAMYITGALALVCTVGAADAPKLDAVAEKGVNYLITKGQAADGSFTKQAGIGITALCTSALLRNGRGPNDPAVAKSLKFLESQVQPDGGIYGGEKSFLRNYETCVGLLCFKEANADKRYDKIIANADKFLRGLQIDDKDGKTKADLDYGGVGYGGKGRPDLSNTAFLVEAIVAAGAGPEDENVQQALIFISRCQNLESEHNTSPLAAKINDGGFYYTLVNDGEGPDSKKSPDGGLRSYGSMSYAGFKSMLYAGLKPDDPRVKAAVTWLRKHYDLKANPGLNDAGLFYYYHLLSKALSVHGEDQFTDDKGKAHDWRAELVAELAGRQNADGSWVNKNRQWLETDPNLVTAYALLALAQCRK